MKKNQSGFTLIEIAIVMVIIGLLLGGVLKGQAMINSAKVRSLNNGLDGISAAWFAFQDRYRVMPGDMPPATASAQILAGIGVGGDGNGIVSIGVEAGALWLHLASAGFISGNYSGNPTPAVATMLNCTTTIPTNICPDNRFGVGFIIASVAAPFPAPAVNHLYTGSQIPVGIVAELDRKIDDGIPGTGSAQASTTNGAVATCVAAAAYNVTGTNAGTDCGLAVNSI